MCGIVGYFAPSASSSERDALSERLLRGTNALRHRGPDAEGVFITPDRSVGLGHRRLSIIDLTDTANQPLTDSTGTLHTVFNGEIYNYHALRDTCITRGSDFRTRSDTEVILELYRHFGERCLERLRGMFAFAIYDARNQTLFMARDRVGKKPLFHARVADAVVFASEIKALFEFGVPKDINESAIPSFFTFLCVPAPDTLFREVRKFPPAHYALMETASVETRSYWTPYRLDRYLNADAANPAAEIRRLFEESVRLRNVADVPVGAFLSGGIDSTAVVGLMSSFRGDAIRTYSIGFENENTLNELPAAREIARRFKTDHHEYLVSESSLESHFDRILSFCDEPMGDHTGVFSYFLSRYTRDDGTKVVQVGEGSDELFGGYVQWEKYLRLRSHPAFRIGRYLPRPVFHLAYALTDPWSPLDNFFKSDMLRRLATDEELYWSGTIGMSPSRLARLLRTDFLENKPSPYAWVVERLSPLDGEPDPLRRMTYLELGLRLPELLLARTDQMTMASSIEARAPFLDHELIEYALALAWDVKMPHSRRKTLLKDALRDIVPSFVLDAPKQGFGNPFLSWLFRRENVFSKRLLEQAYDVPYFREDFVADLRHTRTQKPNATQLWAIMCFAEWYHRVRS